MELSDISPCIWLRLFGVAIVASLIVRLASSLLKALELYPDKTFWNTFGSNFLKGRSLKREQSDYWYPYIIGVLELSSFPVIMLHRNGSLLGLGLRLKHLGTGSTGRQIALLSIGL